MSKLMPTMESLKIDLASTQDDDDDDEHKGGSQLLSILMKLKGAKAAMEQSKKRKHAYHVKAECLDRFRKEAKEIAAKYKRKIAAAKNTLQEKYQTLQAKATAAEQRIQALNKHIEKIDSHKNNLIQFYNRLDEVEKKVLTAEEQGKAETAQECNNAEHQLHHKLDELKECLHSIQKLPMKDDKINELIKTVVQEFLV